MILKLSKRDLIVSTITTDIYWPAEQKEDPSNPTFKYVNGVFGPIKLVKHLLW